MISVFATFSFEGAHFLPLLPDDHKCKRLHGHNWTVEIHVEGDPDARGFIVDFYDVESAWMAIHRTIDHRLLNEIAGLENPTTEIIVQWIAERMESVRPSKIVVRETPAFGAVWLRP